MTYLTTREDTQLYVKQWGAGRPVILLHGWPLSSDMWDHHAMKLAEAGYRTIAYDRRGFGRSSQPWTGYDYDTLADDLASVIEQTGARDAVLVGFSMGGGEVARYMSRHAGKGVTQAALVSSVVPPLLRASAALMPPSASDRATVGALGAVVSRRRASVSVPVRPNRLVTLTCGV